MVGPKYQRNQVILRLCELPTEFLLSRLFVYLGFLVALAGQAIRTLAMYTAGSNFHHLIREEREKVFHLFANKNKN